MRILVDICHPAHAHFFRFPIALLRERGHDVLVTSRVKEMALSILDGLGFEHQPLSKASGRGAPGLLAELWVRNWRLYKVVKKFRPDVMMAVGGTFVAQVGFLTRTPTIVFYDTENARVQNLMTYPFASLVLVPDCYDAWLPKHAERYKGYHELSYLQPSRFSPDRLAAIANGLDPDRENFLVRVVAWNANHDIGERGWTPAFLEAVVGQLTRYGNVLISAEGVLPGNLQERAFKGDPMQIHHVLAHCRLVVGESATMASEAAVLGVPAIYMARTTRGYTEDQERRYGLVRNLRHLDVELMLAAIEQMLAVEPSNWKMRRAELLDDSIDVAGYVVRMAERLAATGASSG